MLPKLPSEHSGSLKSLPLLFRRPALMCIYLLTVVVVTAHYTAYSYIEPFVQNVAGFSANFATVLLGGAGIIGSVLFGKLGNQHASALVSSAIAMLVASLVLMLPASGSETHLAVLSIFWGYRHHDYRHGDAGQSAGAGSGCNRRGDVALFRHFQYRHWRRRAGGGIR